MCWFVQRNCCRFKDNGALYEHVGKDSRLQSRTVNIWGCFSISGPQLIRRIDGRLDAKKYIGLLEEILLWLIALIQLSMITTRSIDPVSSNSGLTISHCWIPYPGLIPVQIWIQWQRFGARSYKNVTHGIRLSAIPKSYGKRWKTVGRSWRHKSYFNW